MKVILLESVKTLGKAGDVVEVKDGYGRNYLLPQGLATIASKGNLKNRELIQDQQAKQEEETIAAAEGIAAKLGGGTVTITAKAGAEGKLFGSVTSTDIAAAIAAQLNEEVDRREIQMADNIKELGTHTIAIRLHPEVTAEVTVEVASDDSGEE